jgi:DNA-binding CsgD family transcriptional regulator
MKNKIIDEVQKKWTEIGMSASVADLELEIELYKKLLDIVHVGRFYYFIFNPPSKRIHTISNSMKDILGYDNNAFSIDFLLECIHPDDLPRFVEFETAVVDFKMRLPMDKKMKYKTRYNYRIRTKEGNYLNIVQQSVTVQMGEDGAVLSNLIFHTDITEFSPSSEMKLSFLGLDGEPSYLDVQPKLLFERRKELFTRREKEVLKCVVQGYNSEKIAQELKRSIHTVRVHRKNILRKSECETVNELIAKCVREGWV